jgi:hypothetical protein
MTKLEVGEAINVIIQNAVRRNGGKWRASFSQEVFAIWQVMGKLSPDPVERREVPVYDPNKVRKVGKQKVKATLEQQANARAILRRLGMI